MMSLRQHRLARLWTLRDLAREAGVTQQTIVNIEHGYRPPRLSTMRKIAAAFDVPATEIAEFAVIIGGGTKPPAPQSAEPATRDASSESAEEAKEA